jgi:hypothetical protein
VPVLPTNQVNFIQPRLEIVVHELFVKLTPNAGADDETPWGFIDLCFGFASMAVVLRKQAGNRNIVLVLAAAGLAASFKIA